MPPNFCLAARSIILHGQGSLPMYATTAYHCRTFHEYKAQLADQGLNLQKE